jgi:hypothetical protein
MFCLILIVGGLLIMMGNTTALKRCCTTSGAGGSARATASHPLTWSPIAHFSPEKEMTPEQFKLLYR